MIFQLAEGGAGQVKCLDFLGQVTVIRRKPGQWHNEHGGEEKQEPEQDHSSNLHGDFLFSFLRLSVSNAIDQPAGPAQQHAKQANENEM